MGTATTMNSLAEALGMQLPGAAAIPAPYRERGAISYETGKRIVDMVREDLKPSDIMTREAFENAIVVNSAIGGSTNAPIHLNGIARHLGVELDNDDWQEIGHDVPLLVNLQPAGEYLGEDYFHAGGVPAVVAELMRNGKLPHPGALTVNGKGIGDNCDGVVTDLPDVIKPFNNPMKDKAGFINLKGNLFDSAIMKTSVISEEFRDRYLSNPDDPEAFEGRAVVFEGPEDYHDNIDNPDLEIDEHCMLFIRGTARSVIRAVPRWSTCSHPQPDQTRDYIPALHRRRPSVGHIRFAVDPERITGSCRHGWTRAFESGDRVRIDLRKGTADILISDEELAQRRTDLEAAGGFKIAESQTPWQEIQRAMIGQFDKGMVLEPAVKYQDVAHTKGLPRDNH